MKRYGEIKEILKWLKGRDHNNTDPTKLLQILNILEQKYPIYKPSDDLRRVERNMDRANFTWDEFNTKYSKISYVSTEGDPDIEWFKSKGKVYQVIECEIRDVTRKLIPYIEIFSKAEVGKDGNKYVSEDTRITDGSPMIFKILADLDIVVEEINAIKETI